MKDAMESMKDAGDFYEVERRAEHAARPGFLINELQISPTQTVPWHFHSHVQDSLCLFRCFDVNQHPVDAIWKGVNRLARLAVKRSAKSSSVSSATHWL